MSPLSVVEDLDVIKDVSPRHIARFVNPFPDSFFLQATKERLGNGIDAPMSTNGAHSVEIANYQGVQLPDYVTL